MARMSGAMLGNFLKIYEKAGKPVGQAVRGIGQEIAEQGMQQAAKNILKGNVVGKTAEEIGKAGLSSGVTQAINLAGGAAQYGGPALAGAYIAGVFDQQNVGSQPFRGKKTGSTEFDSFLHEQALTQQRLENEMAVIRQKAILGVPSPLEMAQAEKLITESGEATNQEVMGIARSLYGTGLRA